MEIENFIDNGLGFLIVLILITFLWNWISLLRNKREPQKSNIICDFMIASSQLFIVILNIIAYISEENQNPLLYDIWQEIAAMTLFLIFAITELIIYRKKQKKQDIKE